MQRRTVIRNLMLAGAAPFVPRLLAFPQQGGAGDFVIRSEVRLVLLDVSVQNSSGGYVPGLSKDNFTVLENGRPQPITVFAHEDLPVTVGILVDESRSMLTKRTEVLAAAEALIAASNSRDEIFVLNFNDTVRAGLPAGTLFSSNIQQLNTALNRGIPAGRTTLYDAVIDGLNQLDLGKRDKKALIVISDGGDTASRHTRRDVFERLESSIATVYTIGLFDADDTDRSPSVLKHLAEMSGGTASFPPTLEGIADVCREIAGDIRTRYTVGYIPRPSNGGSLRRIHVSVSSPSHVRLVARARTRYRYEELPQTVSR